MLYTQRSRTGCQAEVEKDCPDRYGLSFRDVEDLLAERGIIVSYETIRQWCVQPRRDGRAARRFFRKLLKGQRQEPSRLVTDKLGS